MNRFSLFISLFILIFFLILLNKLINFKPYINKQSLFTLERFADQQCSNSKTVESIRSCFNEVVKGQKNYINDLENNLKKTSSSNTSGINSINKQIEDINKSVDTIKKNVEDSSKILKTTQNSIYSKANQTTDMLQKAEKAKDQVQSEAK